MTISIICAMLIHEILSIVHVNKTVLPITVSQRFDNGLPAG
jgi:hypothetical protein